MGSFQRQQGNFGRTVPANGEPYGSYASIGIERHLSKAPKSPWVFSAEFGKDRGTNYRQADLTSMRVTRELQVYWIISSDVRKIWFVGEQERLHDRASQRLPLSSIFHSKTDCQSSSACQPTGAGSHRPDRRLCYCPSFALKRTIVLAHQNTS